MTHPFKQKVEELAHLGAPSAGAYGEPPAKRACSMFEKKLQKLPAGDLTLARDCPYQCSRMECCKHDDFQISTSTNLAHHQNQTCDFFWEKYQSATTPFALGGHFGLCHVLSEGRLE